jgi:hypothetical protein
MPHVRCIGLLNDDFGLFGLCFRLRWLSIVKTLGSWCEFSFLLGGHRSDLSRWEGFFLRVTDTATRSVALELAASYPHSLAAGVLTSFPTMRAGRPTMQGRRGGCTRAGVRKSDCAHLAIRRRPRARASSFGHAPCWIRAGSRQHAGDLTRSALAARTGGAALAGRPAALHAVWWRGTQFATHATEETVVTKQALFYCDRQA